MKATPRSAVGSAIAFFLSPFIYILAFNHFFALNIPMTFESWFAVFLVGILFALVFIGLLILGLGSALLSSVLAIALIIGLLLLTPVIYIWSFNVVLNTSVPIALETYALVVVTFVANALITGVIKGK